MSLSFDEISIARENYQEVKNRVISLTGSDNLNSNHYYEPILYGVRIDKNTKDEKIIEICQKFFDLYDKIEELFINNNLELKDEYFDVLDFSGATTFLGKPIDVYKGIKDLEHTIFEFINLYKRVLEIASEYKNLGELDFHKRNIGSKDCYFLYNQEINASSTNSEIDEILYNFDILNKRINRLLEEYNYNRRNMLQSKDKDSYYLFGVKIDKFTTNQELIVIINKAQLFEKNVKKVFQELNMEDGYNIEYDDKATIWLGCSGSNFSINETYEAIKQRFM